MTSHLPNPQNASGAQVNQVARNGRDADLESIQAGSEPRIATEVVGLADFDTHALTHVVAGAYIEHRILPGGGSSMDLLQCFLPHSVINRGNYSPAVLVNGTFGDALTIGTMLHQREETIINGSEIRSGTIQFYAEKSELSYRAWPNATWWALVISRERLIDFCIEKLDEMPRVPASPTVTIESKFEERANQMLSRLRDLDRSLQSLRSLRNAARLGGSVENDILATIASFISAKPIMRKAGDRQRLRACREILQDTIEMVDRDPDEMFDLQSMSKATGLSPRTLQRTFQAEYGLCPQEWLRVERLHRVRDDLLSNPDCESVTHTATRWGFFHLSRFSQYYRELFGEKPSQTLVRRNARPTTKRPRIDIEDLGPSSVRSQPTAPSLHLSQARSGNP